MIPVAFDYEKVKTVEEAIAALSGDDLKILAGGHSLIPAMKLRLSRPGKLIDIGGITALKDIKEEDGEIVIGAGATHADIMYHNLIRTHLPFFTEGAATIGDMQVRNWGTIGGSLAHADPAADWPAMVLAADATIEMQGVKGRRNIKATEFFTGLFATVLEPNELITAVRIAIPPDGTKSTYQKFAQPASRFALAACAVMRFPDGRTNIAFTGVGDHAFRDTGAEQAISGKAIDDASVEAAMLAALQNVDVMSDHYASEPYRRHLSKVYLKKALMAVKS
ncbi:MULTISPECIES: FAD binding domain-containing protein [Niastella]|uniref:Xanthine dehydrogenase family protein subunit M n=1 Tax=Niastella soli TaxID=2821487 RepID=A0ABS3Z126_9BACT|nr:xanthine dehydrogenase family protein subunit M [Niastella soli]MBO9203728.1 xanthine dehydrogenase family protein subunit M [Niastella soli]